VYSEGKRAECRAMACWVRVKFWAVLCNVARASLSWLIMWTMDCYERCAEGRVE